MGPSVMPQAGARERAARIVFGQDTLPGKAFDLVVIAAILASVATVMLETVPDVAASHRQLLRDARTQP